MVRGGHVIWQKVKGSAELPASLPCQLLFQGMLHGNGL